MEDSVIDLRMVLSATLRLYTFEDGTSHRTPC